MVTPDYSGARAIIAGAGHPDPDARLAELRTRFADLEQGVDPGADLEPADWSAVVEIGTALEAAHADTLAALAAPQAAAATAHAVWLGLAPDADHDDPARQSPDLPR